MTDSHRDRRRACAVTARLLAAVLVAGSASGIAAQGLDPLSSGSSAPTLIEAAPALQAAEASFERAVDGLLRDVVAERDPGEDLRARLESIVAEEKRGFAEAADSRVAELRGDGVLTADELSGALGTLRADRLARLEERLRAAVRGIDAPPVRAERTSAGRYVGRLLEYTLVERNHPVSWLILLASVAGGLALAWGASRALDLVVRQLRRGRRRRTLEDVVAGLSGPLYLTLAVAGIAAGLRWIWIPVSGEAFVWTVLRLTFAAAGYWLLWNVCGVLTSAVARAARRTDSSVDDQVIDVVRKGLRLFVSVTFVLFVTEVVFRSDIRGLLAGIGIAGIALSFAAQDTLKNVIASFTIFGDRPFVLGDLIEVGDHFGTVEAIGFRSTRIREFDGHLVTIPNAELITSTLENVSARPYIRRRFYLDLPFGSTPDTVRKAIEIVHEVLDDRDCWPDDFEPKVEFTEFGPYSLRLLVEYLQQPPDYWGAFARDTKINLEILAALREAGIELAFPTREVVLDRGERST